MTEGQTFAIHIIGDETAETFTGTFRAKEKVSQGDILAIDSRRRELLGVNGFEAPPDIQRRASIIAELTYRLIEWPDFWKQSRFGLDIVDDNVLLEVYDKTQKVRENWLTEQKKKGEAARAALAAKVAAETGGKK
jgi:hypothetical protein